MDPVENPYSPGAGSPPPELAGRDRIREQVRVAIARIRVGNSAKSVLMVGLRGVGKTVLLDQMRSDAERTGIHTIRIEAPENKSLPALLGDTSRNGNLCTFAESRCNVLNRLAGQRHRIAPSPRTTHSLPRSC
jgi:Cdc6-like AAA superfamily ATPase